MKVYTEDIKSLLEESMLYFEKHHGKKIDSPKLIDFFKSFCDHIKRITQNALNPETLYKQFYIRLKSWDNPHIGFSVDYLNSLSQYLHQRDYSEVYKTVFEDDSEIPEFPWTHPSFPATPTVKIEVPGFRNVWVKDESHNPTGISKDRLAWEIYLYYEKLIRSVFASDKRLKIPRLSIISSGNAALSIQYILKKYGLPNLKVIINPKFVSKELNLALINSKCEIFHYDLQHHRLTAEEILKITDNEDGKDITYGYELDKISYYDWMSYEILNLNPQYCFIPFGSGDLYKNILEIIHRELMSKKSSKRFFGNKDILQKCAFLGARAKSKNTEFKMLYSEYNALEAKDMKYFYDKGTCSKDSNIYYIDEKHDYYSRAKSVANANNLTYEPSGIAGLVLFFQVLEELKMPPEAKIVIVNTGKIKLELFQ